MTAAGEAAKHLRAAESGYIRTYGDVPLDKRIELAKGWIDLARLEAQQSAEQ
ncbi:hypothetical protein IC744_14075 [Microbacterium hominis]|uniref:hypothetical protein n=1 Tax=Microbacterium TaxID=33882 RepID=UPI00168BC27B|nr:MULTISPECIES: hypothetical protein [Microbacterium]QOC24408.1 hypothetical protein IC745_08315 [Microbacterium hominis]QOC28486.1 hypothetical protein IC744_14075 [Microbacterium hominis]QYF96311.1 hypothetical protein KY498_08830 [Microbacterium sp. PAMC21962]